MQKGRAVLLGAVIVLPACGGSSPAAPTPSPSPVVVATPTPTPVPATTPAPSPPPEEGEPPVTNTNPAMRLSMRIFVIENPDGTYTGNVDPKLPIPVGHTARLDVTAKDLDNRETVGRSDVEFFFSDPGLAGREPQQSACAGPRHRQPRLLGRPGRGDVEHDHADVRALSVDVRSVDGAVR